jgi:hypothetical protein
MREVGARFSRTLPARGAQRQYERRYAQAVEHFETEWGGVLPASSESVVRYLAAYGAQLSSDTLRTHLAALAQWQQQYGFDDPTKASRVRDVLRGIQALHPQPIKQAEALHLQRQRQRRTSRVWAGSCLPISWLCGCARRGTRRCSCIVVA